MTAPIQYDYSGQVVCITGGSRGLGHAMALGFAAAGAGAAFFSTAFSAAGGALGAAFAGASPSLAIVPTIVFT